MIFVLRESWLRATLSSPIRRSDWMSWSRKIRNRGTEVQGRRERQGARYR
jgi:hypothetical protein